MIADAPLEAYFLEDRAIGDGWFVAAFDHPRIGGGWLAFREPVRTLTAWTLGEVQPLLDEVADADFAAGFVAYDAAPAFDAAFQVRRSQGVPLACFHIYDSAPVFYKELLRTGPDVGPAWELEIGRERFLEHCAQVRRHLAAGDSYQVNLSFRLRAANEGSLATLFSSLAADEPPPFSSLFLAGDLGLASLSPELFFEVSSGIIRCKPMKGTAPLGEGNAGRLQNSEKDRAENLMIVDMIRNDLGRVADVGTVRATSLFDVEAFPTVLQMTSTVQASFSGTLREAFCALFPCASIVGAPKVKTMEIIRDLEESPRGVYTGAIGFAAPDAARFSVAIRTIAAVGERLEYGAGSGIVWDSVPESEWEETLLKTEVLKHTGPDWGLIETFGWPCEHVDRHLDRMGQSAGELGVPFDRARAMEVLSGLGEGPLRVRLTLFWDGRISMDFEPLVVPGKLRSAIALVPVCSQDPSLRHKTNRRRIYDRALRETGMDESLLWNERGEATEFCKGNLVARFGDRLVTPPVECGLLPGVLRGLLVERGEVLEEVVRVEDLAGADEVWRVSSLAGWVSAELDWPKPQKDVD